jgi:SAM-dependent methyltransferase
MTDAPAQGPSTQGSPEWWDARYQEGDVPWDTGVVPPEVIALVQGSPKDSLWALDLGCGTGLNTRYLAAHGFRAVGVDLAQSALAMARKRAVAERVKAFFCCADVSDLSFLRMRAALALDVGCFHALGFNVRARYVSSLASHLLPGAALLLYVHRPSRPADEDGPAGADERAIAGFAEHFDLLWTAHGEDRTRPSAWHLLRRR